MNDTRNDGLINTITAFLSLVLSVAAIAAWMFGAFAVSKPDGTTTLSDVVFFPPLIGIYLFSTLVNSALGAWLWRASSGWIAFIAASPYLLWAILSHEPILWGAALLTFGVQYAAIRFRRSAPKPTVA